MERRRIGNVEVISLMDNIQVYPASAVYPERAADLAPFSALLDNDGGLSLGFACFLLVDGDRRILVDTGWGPEFAGRLPEELAAAGVAPGAIDTVIFTHLHGDHTGWNFDRSTGQPLFPAARYLVPRADWDHHAAETPPPDSFTRDVEPLKALGRMDLIEGERALTPSLTTLPTPGHTPGHTSIAILSGGERGFILGDAVISMVDAAAPDWPNSFEWDATIARQTRRALIPRLAAERSLVGASHLPAPGFGRFAQENGASRWDPA